MVPIWAQEPTDDPAPQQEKKTVDRKKDKKPSDAITAPGKGASPAEQLDRTRAEVDRMRVEMQKLQQEMHQRPSRNYRDSRVVPLQALRLALHECRVGSCHRVDGSVTGGTINLRRRRHFECGEYRTACTTVH